MLQGGYKVLDVRSDRERTVAGAIRGSIHIPFTKDRRASDNKIISSKV